MDKKIILKIGCIGLVIGVIIFAIGVPQYIEVKKVVFIDVTSILDFDEKAKQAMLFLRLGGGIAVISLICIFLGVKKMMIIKQQLSKK